MSTPTETKKSKKNLEEEQEDIVSSKSKNKKLKSEDKVLELSKEEEIKAHKKHKKDKKKKKDKDREEVEEEKEKAKKQPEPEPEPKPEPKPAPEPEVDVHTANNWEEADLGDGQRKLKFLKLMGAFKHKSEKEVSHKHTRPASETKKIAEDLEKQFNEGLSNKFKLAHHVGLGFGHASTQLQIPTEKPKLPESKHITFDD